jgi:hypothetical protein
MRAPAPGPLGFYLFAGCWDVPFSAEPLLDAVCSLVWEEGRAPAGSIFADGVLAFEAAVPAVAPSD